MATYDRKKHLKQIHESRKAITMSKVDEAIKRLVRANQEINFNSVASEAGVAKATLYNNVTLHMVIYYNNIMTKGVISWA